MESLLATNMDDSEEEEDILQPNLMEDDNSSEEEEDDLEEKHASLLKSIALLSDQQKKKIPHRTVATADVSEFGFSKNDEHSHVNLTDLISSLNASASAGKLIKQVKAVEQQKISDIPLFKPQQDRLTRSIAYKATTEELSKWQPLVQQNRKAEQLTFPLQQPNYGLKTSDEMTKRFQARTPLEREIAMLLHGSDNVEKKTKMLTRAEEKALKAMSLEEAMERRAQLMKYRALMTYNEAKFRRQKKIKSKRFHKILRKEKLKKEEKELDTLQQTDPEAYLDKLEYVDRARVEERMSLKHRGGSKFARKKMMYARYDPVARQAVEDMIQKNKELTKKQYVSSDESDDNISMAEDEEFDISAAALNIKGDNPWMKAPVKSSEFTRPKTITQAKKYEQIVESDSEEDDPLGFKISNMNTEVNLLELEAKRQKKLKLKKQNAEVFDLSNMDSSDKIDEDLDNNLNSENDDLEKRISKSLKTEEEKETPKKSRKRKKKANLTSISTKDKNFTKKIKENTSSIEDKDDIEDLFNILEDEEKRQAVKKLTKKEKQQLKIAKSKGEIDQLSSKIDIEKEEEHFDKELLSQSTTRKRTVEEYSENWSKDEQIPEIKKPQATIDKPVEKKDIKCASLDPKKLFTIQPTVIKTKEKVDIVTNEDDDNMLDDEDDQRMTIAQAFADDDVIEEFKLEKKDITDKDKPKDINLVLPGWGDWGGDGIEVSKKKKKKFIIKRKGGKRKDDKMGNVILNEAKDTAVSEHQVKDLPRQFLNPKQFEQSIRQPIGNTWNPEKAFHRMIQPNVITQLGSIIKPIDKEEMFKKQKIDRKAGGDFDKKRQNHHSKNGKDKKKKKTITKKK